MPAQKKTIRQAPKKPAAKAVVKPSAKAAAKPVLKSAAKKIGAAPAKNTRTVKAANAPAPVKRKVVATPAEKPVPKHAVKTVKVAVAVAAKKTAKLVSLSKSKPLPAPKGAKTPPRNKAAKTASLGTASNKTPTAKQVQPTQVVPKAKTPDVMTPMKHEIPHEHMDTHGDRDAFDDLAALPPDVAMIDKELHSLSDSEDEDTTDGRNDAKTTGSQHDEHEDLHDPDSDPDFDSGDFSLEDDFDFGDLEAPGPDTCQFTEHDLALALRDFQVDMQGASGAAEKLDHAKKAHLPGLKGASGKRKKPVTETPSITADDFEEGHQRDAFIIIQEFYRVLLNSDSKINSRLKAVEFFFCPATPQRINFDEAAVAIDPNIRPDVFRLRLMFEFWNRWTMFGRELPEDALPPPDRVMSMANFHGPAAVALVTECWYYPGIAEHELMERAENYLDQNHESHEKVHLQREYNNLTSNYILSVKSNSVYCTGKNPIMEVNDSMRQSGRLSGARAAQTSWAKLF